MARPEIGVGGATKGYIRNNNNEVFWGVDGGQKVQSHWIKTDLKVTHDLLLFADRGESSAVLFLDLRVAFDTVDGKALLPPLQTWVGFLELNWFPSHLSVFQVSVLAPGAHFCQVGWRYFRFLQRCLTGIGPKLWLVPSRTRRSTSVLSWWCFLRSLALLEGWDHHSSQDPWPPWIRLWSSVYSNYFQMQQLFKPISLLLASSPNRLAHPF